MRARREAHGLPPMTFGSAGYAVVRSTDSELKRELGRITDVQQTRRGYANYEEWIADTQREQRVSLDGYAVSNRGRRGGRCGTPGHCSERMREFERDGSELRRWQF